VAALAARLGPEQAAQQAAEAARLVLQTLAKETESNAGSNVAEAVAALAARLGPEHAAKAVRQSLQALAKAAYSMAGLPWRGQWKSCSSHPKAWSRRRGHCSRLSASGTLSYSPLQVWPLW
jgi:hypothetical protein